MRNAYVSHANLECNAHEQLDYLFKNMDYLLFLTWIN